MDRQNTNNEFWEEFNKMWESNWYDGLSTFDKERLNTLLSKYGIKRRYQ